MRLTRDPVAIVVAAAIIAAIVWLVDALGWLEVDMRTAVIVIVVVALVLVLLDVLVVRRRGPLDE